MCVLSVIPGIALYTEIVEVPENKGKSPFSDGSFFYNPSSSNPCRANFDSHLSPPSMDDFVGEDGELFVDPGACGSSPEHDGNRGGSPAAAHGGNHVSASKPRNRLVIKGGSGVRHGEGREYLGERWGADLEEGGGPRKRKRAAGLTDQPALGWGPEKHGLKRRKEGRRVSGEGFLGGHDEQREWERQTMAAARIEAEEDKEHDTIDQLFQSGRNKTSSHPRADAGLIIEELMAEFEVAFEDDVLLNRESKAGTNKLKKLPLLIKVLSKKNLQKLFLQHGILALLKNWLQPLPDGSMPSADILAAILRVLTDFPIDLEQPKIREQLKKSGLRKVIMLLSKCTKVTELNRKLANEVINKWSPQVEITRSDDMRRCDDKKAHYRPPQ
ncbi:hypothetical protein ACQ4PT_067799 [Festuca glaucescens]